MPQSPLVAATSQKPNNAFALTKVDSNGNLLVALTSDTVSGGLPVKAAGLKYATVAASQTAQALGTGAIGDVLNSITYVPATTAAGVLTIIDGTGGGAVTISLFVGGGTTALTNLQPVTVSLNLISAVGGWHVTTGANISAVAVGQFTA